MNNLVTTTKPIIECSQIVVYNESFTISKYEFIDTTTSRVIYVSDKYKRNQTWVFDLVTADIKDGSQFNVKALVEAGSDSTADVSILCNASSNVTAYLKLTGTTFDTTLTYVGNQGITTGNSLMEQYKNNINKNNHKLLQSYKNIIETYEENRQLYEKIISKNEVGDSIPIFQCSRIYAYNESATVTQWGLLTPDDTAMVYISGKCHVYEDWSINLDDLERVSGTEFRLKAIVSAGSDSLSNVLIQFIPDSNITGYFALKGNAFDTTITFYGSADPNLK